MRIGRVYSAIDWPATAASGPDAKDRAVRALKLAIQQDGVALLMLQRDGPDFRAVDAVHLSNLIPYLGFALKSWRQLDRDRGAAALDRQICRDLGAGWILFSPSGRVQQMAPDTADRLATMAGVYLRADGRLFVPNDNAAETLSRGIAAAVLYEGAAQFVELSRAPVVQMVISAERRAGEPVLVGRLRQGLSARDISETQLASRFGLSRSEARLAAHLCDGFSLREAAQALGWTLETTRSCSKQIYAKTGTNGQTSVVRRMLLDVVWLGQKG
jgi:DNA-binding CsgD family transcriptional regulator